MCRSDSVGGFDCDLEGSREFQWQVIRKQGVQRLAVELVSDAHGDRIQFVQDVQLPGKAIGFVAQ